MRWTCLLMACGCAHSIVDLEAASEPLPPSFDVSPERVEARACRSYFLFLIPMETDMKAATASALLKEADGGHGLVSVAIEEDYTNWVLGHTRCFTVSGRRVLGPPGD